MSPSGAVEAGAGANGNGGCGEGRAGRESEIGMYRRHPKGFSAMVRRPFPGGVRERPPDGLSGAASGMPAKPETHATRRRGDAGRDVYRRYSLPSAAVAVGDAWSLNGHGAARGPAAPPPLAAGNRLRDASPACPLPRMPDVATAVEVFGV